MTEQTHPEGPDHQTPEFKTESHDPAVPEAYSRFMRTGLGRARARPAAACHHVVRRRAPRPARRGLPRRASGAAGRRLQGALLRHRLPLPRRTPRTPTSAATRPATRSWSSTTARRVLYARPRSARDTDEFFRDRQYGELWAGRRPSLHEISSSLGLEVRHIDDLPAALSGAGKTRVQRGVDARVDALVAADQSTDEDFARVASELRLIKDEWEVGELQEACDITALGFTDSVAEWERVLEFGERWIEGTFFRRARAMGNDIGYDSIAAGGRHATTLHWIDNTGPITPGELVLLDMGVEGHNLYTADVTRTLPVVGHLHRQCSASCTTWCSRPSRSRIEAVRPGVPFLAAHHAAMDVLAHGLESMGLLPVSAAEALDPESKVYARWTLHGVSHMLGMDVHDCGDGGAGGLHQGRTSPRAWCSPSSPASTSRRTTCWSPRSSAASASGSRTTSSSPPTATGTSPTRSPAPPRTSRRGWAPTCPEPHRGP